MLLYVALELGNKLCMPRSFEREARNVSDGTGDNDRDSKSCGVPSLHLTISASQK